MPDHNKAPGLSDRGEDLEAFDDKRLEIISVYETEGATLRGHCLEGRSTLNCPLR